MGIDAKWPRITLHEDGEMDNCVLEKKGKQFQISEKKEVVEPLIQTTSLAYLLLSLA